VTQAESLEAHTVMDLQGGVTFSAGESGQPNSSAQQSHRGTAAAIDPLLPIIQHPV